MLECLRLRKRELEREVDRVKALIERLNRAPVEMRRHHGFVFESAMMMMSAVDKLQLYLSTTDGLLKPFLERMYLASSTLSDRMNAIVALANSNTSAPISHDAVRRVTDGASGACTSFLENLSEVRCAMRVIMDEGMRACQRVSYRAKLVRAGADAILRNMSADDAEDNVRHRFDHLGEFS